MLGSIPVSTIREGKVPGLLSSILGFRAVKIESILNNQPLLVGSHPFSLTIVRPLPLRKLGLTVVLAKHVTGHHPDHFRRSGCH